MRQALSFRNVPLALAVAAAFLGSCAEGEQAPNSGASSSGSGGGGGGASSSGSGGAGGSLFDAGVPDGGGPGDYVIYASTDDALYQLDPKSADLAVTELGKFDCIGSGAGQHVAMVDIAVNQADELWGVTGHDVMPLTVQGGAVHCGAETPLNNAQPGQAVPTFYALAFAPVGVLAAGEEVLVGGDSAGQLWSISASGDVELHGSFGLVPADDGNGNTYDPANVGKPWELSGDIVFLANNGAPVGFATVRDCPNPPSSTGCSKVDTLIEIEMSKLGQAGKQVVTRAVRGQIVRSMGCGDPATVYGSMYGIAAWNDKVYGFSRIGSLVTIDTAGGSGCLVKSYAPNKFSGAGVTTLAPVEPPPPK